MGADEMLFELQFFSFLRVDELIDALVTDTEDSIVWILYLEGSCDDIGTPSGSKVLYDILEYLWILKRRPPSTEFPSIHVFLLGSVRKIVLIFFILFLKSVLGFWEYGRVSGFFP